MLTIKTGYRNVKINARNTVLCNTIKLTTKDYHKRILYNLIITIRKQQKKRQNHVLKISKTSLELSKFKLCKVK